jgi:hypothetical protein
MKQILMTEHPKGGPDVGPLSWTATFDLHDQIDRPEPRSRTPSESKLPHDDFPGAALEVLNHRRDILGRPLAGHDAGDQPVSASIAT